PIFQPEIGAEAIYWAAHQRRREIDIGLPTVMAHQGQKIVPSLGDRYLASSAYEGQQTTEPIAPGRPDNLFAPVEGDYGAHGTFDAEARKTSLQFWINRNRGGVALS